MIDRCPASAVCDRLGRVAACFLQRSHGATMSIVLPGQVVPAQHVNLKLGPGLRQDLSAQDAKQVTATRAGTLQHSANGSRWWVQSNARRVSPQCMFSLSNGYLRLIHRHVTIVCTCTTRVCGRRRRWTIRGRLATRHRFCAQRHSRCACLRRRQQAEPSKLESMYWLDFGALILSLRSGWFAGLCTSISCAQRHGA